MKLTIRKHHVSDMAASELEFLVNYYRGSCPECYKPMEARKDGWMDYLWCACGCTVRWEQEAPHGG